MLLLTDPAFPGVTPFPDHIPLERCVSHIYAADDPLFMGSTSSIEITSHFAIHRAFHAALDVADAPA